MSWLKHEHQCVQNPSVVTCILISSSCFFSFFHISYPCCAVKLVWLKSALVEEACSCISRARMCL